MGENVSPTKLSPICLLMQSRDKIASQTFKISCTRTQACVGKSIVHDCCIVCTLSNDSFAIPKITNKNKRFWATTYLMHFKCSLCIIKLAKWMTITFKEILICVVNTSNSLFQCKGLLECVSTNKGVNAQMSWDKLKAYALDRVKWVWTVCTCVIRNEVTSWMFLAFCL